MRSRGLVLTIAVVFLVLALGIVSCRRQRFMPKLEEMNLWIRASLPQDVSFDYSAQLADQMRGILGSFPEVSQVVSPGRPSPDDGD